MGTQDATASILGKLDPTKFKCTECGRYKSLDKKYQIITDVDTGVISDMICLACVLQDECERAASGTD